MTDDELKDGETEEDQRWVKASSRTRAKILQEQEADEKEREEWLKLAAKALEKWERDNPY